MSANCRPFTRPGAPSALMPPSSAYGQGDNRVCVFTALSAFSDTNSRTRQLPLLLGWKKSPAPSSTGAQGRIFLSIAWKISLGVGGLEPFRDVSKTPRPFPATLRLPTRLAGSARKSSAPPDHRAQPVRKFTGSRGGRAETDDAHPSTSVGCARRAQSEENIRRQMAELAGNHGRGGTVALPISRPTAWDTIVSAQPSSHATAPFREAAFQGQTSALPSSRIRLLQANPSLPQTAL